MNRKIPCPKCGRLMKSCSTVCKSCHSQKGSLNYNWKGGISTDNMRYKRRQIERYPERVAARNEVRKALRNGTLKKEPCSHCGSIEVEAHHEDYSKPLEVIWWCQKYHDFYHRMQRQGLVIPLPQKTAAVIPVTEAA